MIFYLNLCSVKWSTYSSEERRIMHLNSQIVGFSEDYKGGSWTGVQVQRHGELENVNL